MARLLRWFLYLIGIFVLVNILGYAAVQYYKPKILETINRTLKNGINGDFQIGDLEYTLFEQFPNFSITLSEIYLRGPRYDLYHQDFFQAEKIYVHVQPANLFRGAIDLKSITIRNGNIVIFRTSQGYTNLEVFKKSKTDSSKKTTSSLSLDLGKIKFENTRFVHFDSLKRKSFDVKFINATADFSSSDSSRSILLDGSMFFGGLMFNEQKGAYMFNTATQARLNLEFFPASQRLVVSPSVLQFAKSKVDVSGQFEFSPPGGFFLSIASDEIDYAEGLTLVTRALREKLSKFQFNKPVKLSLTLLGKLTPGDEPEIDIAFTTMNNHFVTGKLTVTDLSFKGTFINHLDPLKPFDDYNSRIKLDTVSGRIAGIPTEAKLMLTDLKDPKLILESQTHLNLLDLNAQTDTTKLKFLSGALAATISYDGKLTEYLDPTTTVYHGKLVGNVNVSDASLELPPAQKKFDHAAVRIHFTEKQMNLDKINFNINGNPIRLKGKITGFVPFFFQPEKKGYVELSLYSPRLDLATLIKKKVNRTGRISKKSQKKISDLFVTLYNKTEFELDLKMDEVVNGPFQAQQLSGKISLMKDIFLAGPVKMKIADGTVSLSLKMSDLDEPMSPIALTAEVRDADIKKFFTSFKNFSQSTITSSNLSGKVSARVQLKATVDEQYNIQMPTLKGDVDFKIRDGKIQDFEPLQKMSNFLFKKRDFTDVQFAEIRSHFRLTGQTLDISRMEIESSVLTLFLEGRYSLADSTDMSIQVPLSNLKKRDKTYEPENVGVDAKVGPSVFLRVSKGKDGKMGITYVPFKKFKSKRK